MQREIREPTEEDADAIGRAHVRAWQAAYRGVMPDEYLDGLRVEDRSAMWRRQMEAPGDSRMLVAALDGVVVGFAVFGPCAEDPECGELYAMNLDPDAWGQGLGRELLEGATRSLAEGGHSELVLWVVPENLRARRLYEAAGWQDDAATRSDEVLGVTVNDMRYRRTV